MRLDWKRGYNAFGIIFSSWSKICYLNKCIIAIDMSSGVVHITINNPDKNVYDVCKAYYDKFDLPWNDTYTRINGDINQGKYDELLTPIIPSVKNWTQLFLCERYIEKHKSRFSSSGGHPGSKKRSTTRRRRSSKARKARNTRRRY